MVLVEGGAPFLGLKTLPFPFPFAVAHLPSGPTILFPVNLLLSWLYLLGGGRFPHITCGMPHLPLQPAPPPLGRFDSTSPLGFVLFYIS